MSSNRNTIPWINSKIKRLIRARNRIHKKAKQRNDEVLWNKFKDIRKTIKKELRKEHNRYVKDMVENLRENPRGLWKYIRSKNMENCGIPTLKKEGTNYITDMEKAHILSDHFRSVFTQENLEFIPFTPSNLPTINDITITKEGVLKLLKTINTNKASGPDGLSPRILKETAEEIHQSYAISFKDQ